VRREPMVADVDLSKPAWRKSSASYDSDCVEVAAGAGLVMVRDTRDVRNTTLAYPCRDWNKFLMRLRSNVSYGCVEPNRDGLLLRGALC
jgi:Domain of unknown function (DUF397)